MSHSQKIRESFVRETKNFYTYRGEGKTLALVRAHNHRGDGTLVLGWNIVDGGAVVGWCHYLADAMETAYCRRVYPRT